MKDQRAVCGWYARRHILGNPDYLVLLAELFPSGREMDGMPQQHDERRQ
jgi:hypothetical protein